MPKRVLTGTVVSDKTDKAVVVNVERKVKHHDEGNTFKEGEVVRIEECAPISKLKTWTVVEKVGGAAAIVDPMEG